MNNTSCGKEHLDCDSQESSNCTTSGFFSYEDGACADSLDAGEETFVKLLSISDNSPDPNFTPPGLHYPPVDPTQGLRVMMRPSAGPASALGAASTNLPVPPPPGNRSEDISLGSGINYRQDVARTASPQASAKSNTDGAMAMPPAVEAETGGRPATTTTAVAGMPQQQQERPEPTQQDSSQVYAQVTSVPDMNIPPSRTGGRINNNEVPEGIAECQMSFQTLDTSLEAGPQALSNPSQPQAAVSPPNNVEAATQGATALIPTSTYPMNNFNSNESNEMNASRSDTNRSLNSQGGSRNNIWSRNFTSIINNDTLLRNLPSRLVNFLASRLQSSHCNNWKNLVELHGWNYDQTYYFEESNRDKGPFIALLHYEGFENYTVEELKMDLENIPRKDVLYDFQKMVTEFNASVNTNQSN